MNACTPLPIEINAITEVTPMMMPRVVSALRSLLAVSARMATFTFSMNMLAFLSLEAQGFDRVQLAGATSGVETKEQADGCREAHGQGDGLRLDDGVEVHKARHAQRQPYAEQDADQATND